MTFFYVITLEYHNDMKKMTLTGGIDATGYETMSELYERARDDAIEKITYVRRHLGIPEPDPDLFATIFWSCVPDGLEEGVK